jgi:hypothetical protein
MKRCRGCGQIIKFIRSTADRLIPVNTQPILADGDKLLVFVDGTVAKTHAKLTHGFVTHFADCPKAVQFKGKSNKARAARR